MPSRPYLTATIASGAKPSDQVKTFGARIGAILFPAAFTGATISFQLPDGAGGWADLATISLTKALSDWVAVTSDQALAIGDDFKIVSSGAEAAERTLLVALR